MQHQVGTLSQFNSCSRKRRHENGKWWSHSKQPCLLCLLVLASLFINLLR